MDLGTAIGLLLTLATVLGGAFGAVKAYGAMGQKVKDLAKDLAATQADCEKLEARLEKAEALAAQTAKLADAVEHLGEKFAYEVKRLGDIFELTNKHTNARLDDIKEQLTRRVGE